MDKQKETEDRRTKPENSKPNRR